MLPCIVIDFFLNNLPDALITQIYSVIKLYMFRAVRMEHNSILTLLGSGHKNLHETYQFRMYSRKFLVMAGKMPEICTVL
jgi:hypothetical protein